MLSCGYARTSIFFAALRRAVRSYLRPPRFKRRFKEQCSAAHPNPTPPCPGVMRATRLKLWLPYPASRAPRILVVFFLNNGFIAVYFARTVYFPCRAAPSFLTVQGPIFQLAAPPFVRNCVLCRDNEYLHAPSPHIPSQRPRVAAAGPRSRRGGGRGVAGQRRLVACPGMQ